MTRRLVLVGILGVVMVACWVFSGAMMRARYLAPDEPFFLEPLGDVAMDCIFYRGVPTTYAPSYTFRKFSRVTVNMTMAEVHELVGEPLLRFEHVVPQVWWYSYKKTSRDFHMRLVAFDTSGRVLFTGAGLNLD
jgi:SmpA / OmlA family